MTSGEGSTAGADPEGFGSSAIDEAARLDAALPDIDWTVPPPGATALAFSAPSGDLSMLTIGDPGNTRVVLVPGVTGSKEDFTLMLPGLAAAGYHVQTYDLAGQYESASAGPQNLRPPRPRYDYDLFVGDLIAVLESGQAPAHVLGYSFAASVAQLAYTQRPELFASLTFLSAPPQPGQAFRGVSRIGRLSWLAPGRVGASLMIWGIKRNFVKVSPGRLRFVNIRFAATRFDSVSDIITLMKRTPDLRGELAASAIPKLVAVGEHDLWPLRLHTGFAREIGAQLAVYRAGHSPCETSPNQLNRDLLALFSRAG
ncbi:alpha/beta fold hydrolase [Lacisediminihabitans profunda]|uniref:alpha/beta fold hydrolase n=1 Tax=Lacisediminihabitans profunda TaxID=2594790 RepID=UPI001FE2F2BD|nr:alpha/beta hydrolase [Lacisediminihabitans profunda]